MPDACRVNENGRNGKNRTDKRTDARPAYQFLERPATKRFSVRRLEELPVPPERKPRKKTPSGKGPMRRIACSSVTAMWGMALGLWEPMQDGSMDVPAARRKEAGSWKVSRPSSLAEPRMVYWARPSSVRRERPSK